MKSLIFIILLFLTVDYVISGANGEPAETVIAKNNGKKKLLSLHIRPKVGEKFRFGQVSQAIFTAKNFSSKAIVVSHIKPITNRCEQEISLCGIAYGSVRKSDMKDAYIYNQMIQRATEMAFFEGLLLAGQQLSVVSEYRPLGLVEKFAIKYYSSRRAYDGTAESLRPFDVYVRDTKEAVYYPYVENNWLNVYTKTRQVSPVGPDVSKRAVLIPSLSQKAQPSTMGTDRQKPQAETIVASVKIQYDEHCFPLGAALKTATRIIGLRGHDIRLAYCQTVAGYVVFENGCAWLLKDQKQQKRGELLPAFPSVMLKKIDWGGSVKMRIGDKQKGFGSEEHPANWNFWDRYPVFYGDGMYTRGEFIIINNDNLLEFLRKVREKGGKIKERPYFFRSMYFVLDFSSDSDK